MLAPVAADSARVISDVLGSTSPLGSVSWPLPTLDSVSDRPGHEQPVPEQPASPSQPSLIDDRYELPEIVPATWDVPATPAPPPDTPQIVAGTRDVVPAAVAVADVAQPVQTAWSDHVPPSTPAQAGLREPGRRPRVRKVTRVVRHVDPWSTFKVALVFSGVGYLVVLTSGVLLWRVADSTGTLDNVERWFTQFGWETFELKGGEIFHNAWIIGLFLGVGLTGAAVLMATLFNLVSDIVGGVRVTVLEEEVVERTASSTRRYVVRRPPLGRAADWSVDDPEPRAEPSATTWSVDDD